MKTLVKRASEFAQKAHVDQKRKYTNEPYFNHLKAVAEAVADATNDPEVIAAAYLHDTLEDTDTSFTTLVAEFGPRVANLVLELTDVFTPKAFPNLNRKARKAKETERLAKISKEAKLIKTFDLMDNTASIMTNDPKFAKVYLAEKAALMAVL